MTIKTPRFLREYANYQISRIKTVCPLISEKDENDIRQYINGNVQACEKGYITVSDAMLCICNRLRELDEFGNLLLIEK